MRAQHKEVFTQTTTSERLLYASNENRVNEQILLNGLTNKGIFSLYVKLIILKSEIKYRRLICCIKTDTVLLVSVKRNCNWN